MSASFSLYHNESLAYLRRILEKNLSPGVRQDKKRNPAAWAGFLKGFLAEVRKTKWRPHD